MFRMKYAIILVLMATTGWLMAAQNPSPGAEANAGSAQQAAPLVRILTPPPGTLLAQPSVTIEYKLTNPAAGTSPNFRVQLDNRNPLIVATTRATLTDVEPGQHTVTVDLVNANNVPVAGARAEVSFDILPPTPQPTGPLVQLHQPNPILMRAALEEPLRPLSAEAAQALPSSAGALPLLSVIGFGVLLGGIASAMKTR